MIVPGIGAPGVGAVVASGSGSGGGVGSVQISDWSIAAVGNVLQESAVRLNALGFVRKGVNGAYTTLETWLLSGAASDYDVRATEVTGTVTSGTIGTWENLGTQRTWTLEDATQDFEGVLCSLLLEIRQAVTPFTVLDSGTIELYSDYI